MQALRDIPFDLNSDGFEFDTEIILQLHEANKTIVEVPIPTYYGGEICHVNGFGYAKDVCIDVHALSDPQDGIRIRRDGIRRARLRDETERQLVASQTSRLAERGIAEADSRIWAVPMAAWESFSGSKVTR